MNRRWPIVLGVVILACLVGWIWYMQARGNAEQKLAPLPEPTPKEQEADEIRVQVEGHDLTVEELHETEGGWALYVTGNAAGTELEKILKQAGDLFKALDTLDVPFADIGLLLRTDDLKDVYGNTLKQLPITEIGLARETFERIDWDGFNPQNFERVADRYWVHEEILKMTAEKSQQGGSGGGGGGGSGGGSSGSGGA